MKGFCLETAPRLVLGLLFLAGSIDGFWFLWSGSHIVEIPFSVRGQVFQANLLAVGFFWPFMKLVELIASLCLLSNRAAAFGLALLSPIMSVIVLFHVFLNPQGLPVAILIIVCGVLLLRAYAPRYARLFE